MVLRAERRSQIGEANQAESEIESVRRGTVSQAEPVTGRTGTSIIFYRKHDERAASA
jgi:hypothetical protein